MKEYKCEKCMDSGKIANDEDQSPWPMWENLPKGSDFAVVVGLVKPIPCPECGARKDSPNKEKSK